MLARKLNFKKLLGRKRDEGGGGGGVGNLFIEHKHVKVTYGAGLVN